MSAGSVTCMIICPLRAFSGTPLTSILTVSSAMGLSRDGRPAVQLRGALHERATPVLDHVLKLGPKMLQEALHRPRRGIAERANGVPFDAIRHVEQQAQVLASALAGDNAFQHPIQPACPFTARRALSAGLRHIEARQTLERAHHAGGLVHDDDSAGTEGGAGLLQ